MSSEARARPTSNNPAPILGLRESVNRLITDRIAPKIPPNQNTISMHSLLELLLQSWFTYNTAPWR